MPQQKSRPASKSTVARHPLLSGAVTVPRNRGVLLKEHGKGSVIRFVRMTKHNIVFTNAANEIVASIPRASRAGTTFQIVRFDDQDNENPEALLQGRKPRKAKPITAAELDVIAEDGGDLTPFADFSTIRRAVH